MMDDMPTPKNISELENIIDRLACVKNRIYECRRYIDCKLNEIFGSDKILSAEVESKEPESLLEKINFQITDLEEIAVDLEKSTNKLNKL